MTTDAELRHLAELAVRGGRVWLDLRGHNTGETATAIDPATVLSLLDRIDAARAVLDDLRTLWIDPLRNAALIQQVNIAIAALDGTP